MEILVTADPYGYGPASKAKTVSEYFRRSEVDVELVYLAKDTALDFGKLNESTYDRIVDLDETDLRPYISESQADLLVSVMEPEPVFVAHREDIPSVVVDSLFWFWEFSAPLTIVEQLRELRSDNEALAAYLSRLTGNDMDLAAHALADGSYLQRYPGESQLSEVTDAIGAVQEINPIVDRGPYDSSTKRDRVVISLGGQLNPAVTEENAIEYAESVIDILSPQLRSLSNRGFKPIVAGHPSVIENISIPYDAAALEHEEMLSTLNRAIGLLCPPSITSLYEAAMYDVPTFFIPEQHPGHWHEFSRLRSTGGDDSFPGLILGRQFESVRDLTKQDQDKQQGFDQVREDSLRILEIITQVCGRSAEEIQTTFDDYELIEQLSSRSVRAEILERQRAVIVEDADGTVRSGGEQVAERALAHVRSAVR